MRERGHLETIASGTGRRLLGWGIFDRRNGEFSTGVDTKRVPVISSHNNRRFFSNFRASRWRTERHRIVILWRSEHLSQMVVQAVLVV